MFSPQAYHHIFHTKTYHLNILSKEDTIILKWAKNNVSTIYWV